MASSIQDFTTLLKSYVYVVWRFSSKSKRKKERKKKALKCSDFIRQHRWESPLLIYQSKVLKSSCHSAPILRGGGEEMDTYLSQAYVCENECNELGGHLNSACWSRPISQNLTKWPIIRFFSGERILDFELSSKSWNIHTHNVCIHINQTFYHIYMYYL